MNFFDLYYEESEFEEKSKEEKYVPKIIDKIVGCDIDKCFKDTSLYKSGKYNALIKVINNPKTNEQKRIFYKNGGSVGYIEIIQNPELAFAYNISKKIYFLFECKNEEKLIIDEKRCFGFRYYNSKNEYCTLLKIGDDNEEDDYQFLEKLKGNSFYNEELDCFSIVYDSIFSRYENLKDDFDTIMIEGPLYEIMGF